MAVEDINKEKLRELLKDKRDSLEIIDVRTPGEYKKVRIKGSKLIPLNELTNRIDEINWEKEVIFVCQTGNRSKLAANILGADKKILNLQYGIYECYIDGKGENLEFSEDK